jgi:hypothetical protein
MSETPPCQKVKKYRKYVGPSQMATVLGLDPYQTADQLREEIEHGYIPSGNYATQYGCDHESIAVYYYQKLYHVVTNRPKFVVDANHPRIGGIADRLIDEETGLEIKCHLNDNNLLVKLPIKYLVQVAGYLYLYQRKKWIVMSCCLNQDQSLGKYVIHEVLWDEVKERWFSLWYPQIIQFVNHVKWLT